MRPWDLCTLVDLMEPAEEERFCLKKKKDHPLGTAGAMVKGISYGETSGLFSHLFISVEIRL